MEKTKTKLLIVRNVRLTDSNDHNFMRALRLINKLLEDGNEIRVDIHLTVDTVIADYEITVRNWDVPMPVYNRRYAHLYDVMYDGRWIVGANDGLHCDR